MYHNFARYGFLIVELKEIQVYLNVMICQLINSCERLQHLYILGHSFWIALRLLYMAHCPLL